MRALVLLIITMASFNAYAQGIKIDLGLSELDLSLKFGAMFGGFVAGGVFSFDQSGNWTLFISPEAAFDAVNKSAIRKGAQAGFIYHLLGGSKKVTTPLYNATITTSYPASLGIVGKSGYFDYSVIDPQNLLPSTRGTVIENSLGIDFRYDRPSGSSFGGQISTLLASVPSGTENLKTSSVMEILTYWRSSF
jgi:hypothetical protein